MPTIESLIKKVKEYSPSVNEALIRKAYEVAEKAHRNERRASGEPFIIHPLSVAESLAEFKMDEASICAALLHDVVEDTPESIDRIKSEFGEEIAMLVDGVTKITTLKSKSREEYQTESLRKMLFATAKDIRVIIIKLLDKLHNMKTLEFLPKEKQLRISKEVMDVYAPIAYRLGIEKIKNQLEDLAFKYLEPEKFNEIEEKIKKNKRAREEQIENLRQFLENALKEHKIPCKVVGRLKNIYSIYKKMVRKERTFEEIFDVVALRVVTDTPDNCYKIIGIIHSMWKPIPRRFKDFIAMPKVNMYQSLHDVVIGEGGTIIEIQVRTEEMDKLAEEGIAAHWKYKGLETDKKFDKKLSWLKEIMDWQQDASAKEFVESLEIDFFKDEIYVFTPKGDVIELPKGSTPIDFAYSIHSGIGDHCIGAKVNCTFVSLRHELRTGDVVEIMTSKTQKPSVGWMKIVKTAKALSKIKKYLYEEEKIPARGTKKIEREELSVSGGQGILLIEGVKNPKIKLAKCCNPLPGQEIIGYADKVRGVVIHKADCGNSKLKDTQKRKVKVHWRSEFSALIELKVEAIDRVGLLADILNTIASTSTNLETANAKMLGKDMSECTFKIKVEDLDHIRNLIERIKKLKDIKKIYIGKLGV